LRQLQSLENSARQTRVTWSTPRGLDTPLDIPSELPAKDQVLSTDRTGRAQEQRAQPQHIEEYTDERARQVPHALIMTDSPSACRRSIPEKPRFELLRATNMSLVDMVLDQPIAEALAPLNVAPDVSAVILEHAGPLGRLLPLAEALDKDDTAGIAAAFVEVPELAVAQCYASWDYANGPIALGRMPSYRHHHRRL
jgi:hypothetical protein